MCQHLLADLKWEAISESCVWVEMQHMGLCRLLADMPGSDMSRHESATSCYVISS